MATKKKAAPKNSSGKGSGKREMIAPNGDKRLVKRDEKGRIKESDDLGKSLRQDVKQTSKTKVKAGYGDRGDQAKKSAPKKSASKSAAKKTAPKKSAAKKSAR